MAVTAVTVIPVPADADARSKATSVSPSARKRTWMVASPEISSVASLSPTRKT